MWSLCPCECVAACKSGIVSYKMDSYEGDYSIHGQKKPCRTCTDFQSWMKNSSKGKSEKSADSSHDGSISPVQHPAAECPVDSTALGRSGWSLLHTMAAHYPDQPSPTQRDDMRHFVQLFAKLYPCSYCSEDFQKDVSENPVALDSRAALSRWFCERHNTVNRKLHKPQFNCDLVAQRWRDGWDDGSCG